jgi:hypothetical protein
VHRIKTVLVVFVIMLITLTSLHGIVKAAQVQRIHKNQRFVYIDGGTKDGFVMGSTVCIYSFSGKKIACGKVHKLSESKAMVGIDKANAVQIKNGMEARLINERDR